MVVLVFAVGTAETGAAELPGGRRSRGPSHGPGLGEEEGGAWKRDREVSPWFSFKGLHILYGRFFPKSRGATLSWGPYSKDPTT